MVLSTLVRRPRGRVLEVTTMELFFDLVYVFAIIQVSSLLAHHLNWEGALQTLIVFGAVWWVWNYTTWATNWIDPGRLPVRLLMVGLMFGGLVMAAAIPEAFGERGFQFAIAIAAVQVVRPLFMVVMLASERIGRNYLHLLIWSGVAAVVWVAGAFCEDPRQRMAVWAVALAIDVIGPMTNLYVPGLGVTPMRSWDLVPGHLVERNRLIFIIALGETVLAAGREFAEVPGTFAAFLALGIGFALTVSFWWLYFARHADQAEHRLADATNPAAVARGGYAYAHAVLVGGVVVSAVGTELMLAHPHQPASTGTAVAIAGGPAIFLLGLALFVRSTGGIDRFERVVTVSHLAVLTAIAVAADVWDLPLVVTSALVLVPMYVMVGLAAWHARGDAEAAEPVG